MVEACLETTVHDFGAELATEGEEPTSVHVIVQGRARGSVRGADGAEVQIGVLGVGDVIAAEAAFDTPATITVRASGPLTTVRLHGSVARAAAELWDPTSELLQQAVVDGARRVAAELDSPGRRTARAETAQHRRDLIEADEVPEAEHATGASDTDWSRFPRRRRRLRVPVVFGVDEMD